MTQCGITPSELETLAMDRAGWCFTCKSAVEEFEVRRIQELEAKRDLRKYGPPSTSNFECQICHRMCCSRIGLLAHNKSHSWWWDPSYQRLSPWVYNRGVELESESPFCTTHWLYIELVLHSFGRSTVLAGRATATSSSSPSSSSRKFIRRPLQGLSGWIGLSKVKRPIRHILGHFGDVEYNVNRLHTKNSNMLKIKNVYYYYYYYYYQRKWLRWHKIKRLQRHLTISDSVTVQTSVKSRTYSLEFLAKAGVRWDRSNVRWKCIPGVWLSDGKGFVSYRKLST